MRKHKNSVSTILTPSGGNICKSLSATDSHWRPWGHRETIGNRGQTQCPAEKGWKRDLGGRIREWQPDLKQCVARLGGNLNGASVLFHNALHGVEAEAGSLAHTFGCEERLED